MTSDAEWLRGYVTKHESYLWEADKERLKAIAAHLSPEVRDGELLEAVKAADEKLYIIERDGNSLDNVSGRARAIREMLRAAIAAMPRAPSISRDTEWVPQIGEEVRVVEGCADWAADWVDAAGRPLRLWVAGVQAARSGGFNVTVCEQWPLPPARSPFDSGGLTDGFSIGQGGDQLEPLAMSAQAPRPMMAERDE